MLQKSIRPGLVLALLIAAPQLTACQADPLAGDAGGSEASGQTILARVNSVVDGDTIRVRAYRPRERTYTVRLIGIDTPETRKPGATVECGGPEATRSLSGLARPGRRITLRTDPTQDTTDRFGRLLAYVYVGQRQLNLAQVSWGWSQTYVYRGEQFQHYGRFRRAERSARRRNRGVWAACGGDFHHPAETGHEEP